MLFPFILWPFGFWPEFTSPRMILCSLKHVNISFKNQCFHYTLQPSLKNAVDQGKHFLLTGFLVNKVHFHTVVHAGTCQVFCVNQYIVLTNFVLRVFDGINVITTALLVLYCLLIILCFFRKQITCCKTFLDKICAVELCCAIVFTIFFR